MRRQFIAIAALVAFLAVPIPFASTNSDGLEKVAETLGTEEGFQIWGGLMSGYSLEALGSSHFSTLVTGAFGIAIVFLASHVLGKALSRKGSSIPENEV